MLRSTSRHRDIQREQMKDLLAAIDADYLDLTLHVPANVPLNNFWSIVLYDTQTRSMLQTDQQFLSLSSEKGLTKNADGSVDLYFGPKAPAGKENNWTQTIPGKSWLTIFRLYGPLAPWFDKSWKLDDVAEMPA